MRPLKNTCQIAVIGGGLAGLAAARQAVRVGCQVTLFEGSGLFGGQVATVGHLEGLPFPGNYSGQDVAIPLLEQARTAGVHVVESPVEKLDPGARLTLIGENDKIYHPEAVIIASGATLRKLGVPGEEEFVGRGVSQCATCDGGFFRGQDVVVVGGGDGAVHEALELAKTSRRVIMVCRSPLRAKREYIDKLAAKENVDFIWDSQVSEIIGNDGGVSSVRIQNLKNNSSEEIKAEGVFVFIGNEPNTGFVPGGYRTPTGHIGADEYFATSDARIFAVGAVREGFGGTAVQAMAEGIGAAQAAARQLLNSS